MTIHLGKLLAAIDKEANAVKKKMACLQGQATSINVSTMLSLQLLMNKFSQISDLGSTTISLFNRSFSTMIQNINR